ncbi:MAG: murein transglycosylase A [Magnetococcales bacterium]|nr:murein transglycosylase A [Magnetococcales bacterium]MBF0323399.1 murein transglycosylase A [Magnetococcales bacterium]
MRRTGLFKVVALLLALLLLAVVWRLVVRKTDQGEVIQGNLRSIAWGDVQKFLQNPGDLHLWADALEASAAYYDKQPPGELYKFGAQVAIPAAAMAKGCRDLAAQARKGSPNDLFRHLAAHYRIHASVGRDGQGDVLVTGYYEPLLTGSLQRSEKFRFPLYRRPEDLLDVDLGAWFDDLKGRRLVARMDNSHLQPYFDRTEIDQGGRLANRGLELAWVEDSIALFFLQIQGSGRILLPDGSQMRVGYDGANGRPYRAIGGYMLKEGMLQKSNVSLQSIRAWLQAHPEQMNQVLQQNPSYVFFRPQEGGPFGNIQVPLTPGYSIATDHREFPKGAPALLVSRWPRFAHKTGEEIAAWEPIQRLVVNQDTGGAIRGPGRVDWFMGFGPEAERVAGVMKPDQAALYFIVPKLEP